MSYPYHVDHPNVGGPDTIESTPELPELQQEAVTLDVKGVVEVANVVRVQDLPSRHATSASYTLQETIVTPLLNADKRRKRMTIIGIAPSGTTSRGVFLGTEDAVRAGTAALWPYSVPCVVEHTEKVYAKPDGTSLAAGHLVSCVAESWAD